MENKVDGATWIRVTIIVAIIGCIGAMGAAFISIIPEILKSTPTADVKEVVENPTETRTDTPLKNPSPTPDSTTSSTTLQKSAISYGELVYEENFDTYPNSWDPENNYIDSGNLILASKNDLVPFGWGEVEPPIYSDFIFEVQFSFPKASTGIEFGIRSQYPPCAGWNCSITVVLDRALSSIFVYRYEYGEHSGHFTSASFDSKKTEYLPDQPNRLIIIADGTEYKVYINDYYIMKFNDDRYTSGTFGFNNPSTAEISIDYIRYYELQK